MRILDPDAAHGLHGPAFDGVHGVTGVDVLPVVIVPPLIPIRIGLGHRPLVYVRVVEKIGRQTQAWERPGAIDITRIIGIAVCAQNLIHGQHVGGLVISEAFSGEGGVFQPRRTAELDRTGVVPPERNVEFSVGLPAVLVNLVSVRADRKFCRVKVDYSNRTPPQNLTVLVAPPPSEMSIFPSPFPPYWLTW